MKKCVFFDRDGIVNQSPGPGYVETWEEFHLLPEFVDTLRIVTDLGYAAIVISNQQGVALGCMTTEAVDDMHNQLRTILREQHGLGFLDIFYCPHKSGTCECRKPKPGMILEAARRHQINLAESWMVGDSPSDAEAGKAAGCRTILVGEKAKPGSADFIFRDMGALRSGIGKLLREGGNQP